MSNYGLQLCQKKQPSRRPSLPPLLKAFSLDDNDSGVEEEISRQASKNKALKEIEEQQRKALEEDPNVFDYDGCYDEVKAKSFRRKVQERADTQPKYIHKLIHKAEERKREHDIIYERKLAKERGKDEHLFADKEKFVTAAYKKKLEEQRRWEHEQARRDLRDERDDVTKKSDVTDFYFNLHKNVAFGGNKKVPITSDEKTEVGKPEKDMDKTAVVRRSDKEIDPKTELRKPKREEEQRASDTTEKEHLSTFSNSVSESSKAKEGHQAEISTPRSSDSNLAFGRPVSDSLEQEKPSEDQLKADHHKRSQDAVAAAKKRFLARRKQSNYNCY